MEIIGLTGKDIPYNGLRGEIGSLDRGKVGVIVDKKLIFILPRYLRKIHLLQQQQAIPQRAYEKSLKKMERPN